MYQNIDAGTTEGDDDDMLPTGQSPQPTRMSFRRRSGWNYDFSVDEEGFEHVPKPENSVEAQRLVNNYMFGFKKWKSHVTERPLESRSDVVKELYTEVVTPADAVPTLRPGNILYAALFGWWLCLAYFLVGLLMFLTVLGRHYGIFCFKLGVYFLWPFGKCLHRDNPVERLSISQESSVSSLTSLTDVNPPLTEDEPLVGNGSPTHSMQMDEPRAQKHLSWSSPGSYIWLLLGLPLLLLLHILIIIITWLSIIMIPVSKINLKTIKTVLFMPPEKLRIDKSSMELSLPARDVVLYVHHAVNIYYYKYAIDGVNVIAANLLIFVIAALVLGYLKTELVNSTTKFVMSMLAIIPLAYYIGLGITSLSAQSNYAVGAVLNATFGSIVEITLYILALRKGRQSGDNCYIELVKSGLVGTLLATMMFIPGLCMVIGGLKHNTQVFNPRSTGLSSTLLFVAVACTFAPTIYSKVFGSMHCAHCRNITTQNVTANDTGWSLECDACVSSIFGRDGDTSMYSKHIQPLVYTCAILMPLAYFIGMIFSLKTHRAHIHESFQNAQSGSAGHGHSEAHWGRIKSACILLVATVLVCLCADIMTENIQELLQGSELTVYFIGVTLVAVVPDIPEIVNGIQFAMANNISLSIELGSCIAVQVCMIQVPLLVLANVIYPVNFYLVFDEIHLWSVLFCVFMMNYVFQDGKSDYFQGSALCFVYFALIALYFFAPSSTCTVGIV